MERRSQHPRTSAAIGSTSKPKLVTHLPARSWIAMRTFASVVGAPRPAVTHDHASIALFLGGRVTFWLDGLYELGAGDLLLVPAGAAHYTVSAKEARSVGVSICLSSTPSTARESLCAIFDTVRRGGCATRHFAPAPRARLVRVFRDLEAELGSESSGADLAIDAHVSQVTVAILRANEARAAARTRTTSASSPIVGQALEYIHRRACTGISLREVAKHVARSPAHVATLVKEATGETVVGWITRARMSEGRQLLLHTDASTEAVGERCGFASASHFYRAFKRAHGTTPGDWRRTHRP